MSELTDGLKPGYAMAAKQMTDDAECSQIKRFINENTPFRVVWVRVDGSGVLTLKATPKTI